MGPVRSGSASGDGETIASSGPDSSSTSTGPAVPVCGDGVVDGDEDCDDGNANPKDGCHNCAKDSVVFVNSEVYQGFALEGIDGADQRGRTLAAKAGLLRPEKFAAWLSTSKSPVADRLNHSRGRYAVVNGLVIAQDWEALGSGTLENPIVVDEYSQTRDTPVWTGTLANGQPALGSEFCGQGSWNVMMFRINEMSCGSRRNLWHLCLSETGTLGGFWSWGCVDSGNIHSEYLQ